MSKKTGTKKKQTKQKEKQQGFMDYKREVSKDVKPKDRIKNFNEFHEHLPREKQQLNL